MLKGVLHLCFQHLESLGQGDCGVLPGSTEGEVSFAFPSRWAHNEADAPDLPVSTSSTVSTCAREVFHVWTVMLMRCPSAVPGELPNALRSTGRLS
jgi:hypothetical protein